MTLASLGVAHNDELRVGKGQTSVKLQARYYTTTTTTEE